MMELALPAGSLQAALQAFKEGADAVYLGMKRFSARKGAANFSFDELAALRRIADAEDRKIYVTVNTIIGDEELPEVISTLRQVAFIGTEGLIVQDLGVARIVRNLFPSIPLHGSTQLAVHTAEGVRAMREAGFSRVVLSRELTLEEIRHIRVACPDIELKVFIHGALCYGFSGLCMASKLLCDRSANCGACAQICRTWFTLEPSPISPTSPRPADRNLRDAWFFSMSDLCAGPVVRELNQMGIDSVKIEGRMKSPAYVAAATRYYRAILDGTATEAEENRLREELMTVFGRTATAGWLAGYGRDVQERPGQPVQRQTGSLGSVEYPGHIGVAAATVNAVLNTGNRTYLQIRTHRPLAVRDGLMFLFPGETAPMEAAKFSLSSMFDRQGAALTHVEAERQIAILVPVEAADHCRELRAGDMLYRISAHDQSVALIHDENLPRRKRDIDLQIEIRPDALTLTTSWSADYLPPRTISRTYKITATQAQKPQPLSENLRKVFGASDTSLFALGSLTVENHTGLENGQVFLPLSGLKEIRRDWYGLLDDTLYRWFDSIVDDPDEYQQFLSTLPVAAKTAETKLPWRSAIISPMKDALPWVDIPYVANTLAKTTIKTSGDLYGLLPEADGTFYAPLSPVMFDELAYLEALDNLVDELTSRKMISDVMFGLNNIAQLRWARRHPQVRAFCDVYLYLGNGQAAMQLLELLPTLEGGYYWLERHDWPSLKGWPFVPTAVEKKFVPPLFISRSCFRHDSLGLSCDGCPRTGAWDMSQHGKLYKVRVNHCVTTVSKVQ